MSCAQRDVARGWVEVKMSIGGIQGGGAAEPSGADGVRAVEVRYVTRLGSLEDSSAT